MQFKRGFTLVEVLVTLGLVGILVFSPWDDFSGFVHRTQEAMARERLVNVSTSLKWYIDEGASVEDAAQKLVMPDSTIESAGGVTTIETSKGQYFEIVDGFEIRLALYESEQAKVAGRAPLAETRIVRSNPSHVEVKRDGVYVDVVSFTAVHGGSL